MAYGIKMWNSTGKVTYSSEDVAWNLITSVVAPENSGATWTVDATGFSDFIITRQMIDEVRPDQQSYIHTVNYLGNSSTLTAAAPSSSYTQRTLITLLGK